MRILRVRSNAIEYRPRLQEGYDRLPLIDGFVQPVYGRIHLAKGHIDTRKRGGVDMAPRRYLMHLVTHTASFGKLTGGCVSTAQGMIERRDGAPRPRSVRYASAGS